MVKVMATSEAYNRIKFSNIGLLAGVFEFSGRINDASDLYETKKANITTKRQSWGGVINLSEEKRRSVLLDLFNRGDCENVARWASAN